MIKLSLRSLCAVVLSCAASFAHASVLTFDDLGAGQAFFLSNYNGFMFGTNDIATTAWFHTDEASTFYKPHSGSVYIATDFSLYTAAPFGPTQPISNTTAFVFNGAWFTGGDPIVYQLYAGNTLVYTSGSSAILTNVPQFVASGYSGLVNSVVIVGHQGYYALDDFTYNQTTTAVVPEPGTVALFGAAALAAIVARRRRKG